MYTNGVGKQLLMSGAAASWPAKTQGDIQRQGTAANDVFYSTPGDVMSGAQGDDTYHLYDMTARAVEAAGQGIDTEYVEYWGAATLPDNVENLVLVSPGATSGTGNALDNILMAGVRGATLNGGKGNDLLRGGAGADLFVIKAGNGSDAIDDFTIGTDEIKLQGYGVSNFADLLKFGHQVGADTQFTFLNGERLVLHDTTLTSLQAADFGFANVATCPAGWTQLKGAGACGNVQGWYVLNNIWNPGNLHQGTDYTVSSVFNGKDVTAGVTFNWSFPVNTDFSPTIRGYPEVIFGVPPMGAHTSDPTDKAHVFPARVGDILSLVADYNLSFGGTASGFNVSYDIWLTSKPNGDASTVTNEVMVWVHKGAFDASGQLIGTYTDGDFTAKIYHQGTYTAIVADDDFPVNKLDIGRILSSLSDLGIVSKSEYVASVELGAEVTGGTGSLTIDKLDLTVATTAANGHATVKLVTGAGTTVKDIAAFTLNYHSGVEQIVGANGATEFKKTVVTDTSVTIQWSDRTGTLLRTDSLALDAKGGVTTQHFDGSWKMIGAENSSTALNGTVTTEHFDSTWHFIGAEETSKDGNGVNTTQHFDSSWRMTGAESQGIGAGGVVTTQHFDGNWHFTGAASVIKGASGSVTTESFDASWEMIGAQTVIAANGVITTEHFDSGWRLLGAESETVDAKGAVTTERFDSSWKMTAAEVAMTDTKGVTTVSEYSGAWKLLGNVVSGTSAADTLFGSSKATEFHGGLGADKLSGGSGVDHFVFDSVPGAGNVDELIGFNVGTDKIVLDHSIFSSMGPGQLGASAFVAGTAALDGQDRVIYDHTTGNLFYDDDGTGPHSQVLLAHLSGLPNLTATDVIIA